MEKNGIWQVQQIIIAFIVLPATHLFNIFIYFYSFRQQPARKYLIEAFFYYEM